MRALVLGGAVAFFSMAGLALGGIVEAHGFWNAYFFAAAIGYVTALIVG